MQMSHILAMQQFWYNSLSAGVLKSAMQTDTLWPLWDEIYALPVAF